MKKTDKRKNNGGARERAGRPSKPLELHAKTIWIMAKPEEIAQIGDEKDVRLYLKSRLKNYLVEKDLLK